MFLDDELLKMCKDAELRNAEDIQKLSTNLFTKCESYYKSRINPELPSSHIKNTLDKAFNLWDSFVRMMKKDENKTLNILGKLYEENSLRIQFLKDEEMKRVYQSL